MLVSLRDNGMRMLNRDAHGYGAGDLGMCFSLNLVVGHRTFMMVDLFLRNKSVFSCRPCFVICVLIFALFLVWDLLGLYIFYVPLEYYFDECNLFFDKKKV